MRYSFSFTLPLKQLIFMFYLLITKMTTIDYYLVDVFTSKKYGGNQLAVFIDFENALCSNTMLTIARELGFAEITFIKKNATHMDACLSFCICVLVCLHAP